MSLLSMACLDAISRFQLTSTTSLPFSTGSSSIVLQGDTSTSPSSKLKIIPGLQCKDIVSVEISDYHSAALAANGKLFTWGSFSHGALGLGDPQKLPFGSPGRFTSQADMHSHWCVEPNSVLVLTEVRFDHGRKTPKDRFCFSAGWHTGALVVDLEVCVVLPLDDERLDWIFDVA